MRLFELSELSLKHFAFYKQDVNLDLFMLKVQRFFLFSVVKQSFCMQ